MKIVKSLRKIPIGYRILGSIVIIVSCPILFTRPWSSTYYFDTTTGAIGDTIGGLTAPAIGLLNAWLLFITLKRQDEQTKLQAELFREQRRYDDYDRRIDNIKSTIQSMVITVRYKDSPQKELFTYMGFETLTFINACFRDLEGHSNTLEKLIFKKTETNLIEYKMTQINTDVIVILRQNFISSRTPEEKQFIKDSVMNVISLVTDFYKEVDNYSKKYPKKISQIEFSIGMIRKLKLSLDSAVKRY